MYHALSGKQVLVTGGTGFIGRHLVNELVQSGAFPVVLVRDQVRASERLAQDMPTLVADLSKPETLVESLTGSFDLIIHCAAWQTGGRLRDAWKINAGATQTLIRLAPALGVTRFVHLSTISVYGIIGDAVVDEDRPLTLYGDPYGDSKILGETVLRLEAEKLGLPWTIIRPGMVYGPGSDTWGLRLIANARKGRLPLLDGGAGLAAPIFITDLVNLVLRASADPLAINRVFNGVADPVAFSDFFGGFMAMIPTQSALRLPGWLARLGAFLLDPFVPSRDLPYAIDLLSRRGHITSDAARSLGWEPRVSLSEGLTLTRDWLRSVGAL